ncbi:MAG: Mur ligase family protein [Deltaproteobacteria bacterium]|nr:Mur ligase family protein [Deltaproteobacteria bacterium]MCX7952027.1 Mur ligase family protein [Deltaproteobacteria bacterium]
MKQDGVLLLGSLGTGMLGLGELYRDLNYEVFGYDDKLNDFCVDQGKAFYSVKNINSETRFLKRDQIMQLITDKKFKEIVFSSAFQTRNLLQDIFQYGIQPKHRFEAVCELFRDKKKILVSGSHGKTTISAILTHLLNAKEACSFYLGGKLLGYDRYAKLVRETNLAVIEGDESDGSFLKMIPYIFVISSIDVEHLEFWKTESLLDLSFYSMGLCVPKCYLAYSNSENRIGLVSSRAKFIPQFSFVNTREGVHFSFEYDGKNFDAFLPFPGQHYARNALCAFLVCYEFGCEPRNLLQRLASYRGVSRRMEVLRKTPLIVSDYAHHPTEVSAVIDSLKNSYQEIVIFFQPHRVSRTKITFSMFKDLFKTVSKAYVLDIYNPLEQNSSCNSEELKELSKLLANYSGAEYLPCFEEIFLREIGRGEGDIYLVIGAGDIDERARHILERV